MTTLKLPPRHPNPAVLVECRRQAQAIAEQSVALAMALAVDYGKAMELRPDFWGRPFLDYKAGSGWDEDEPAAMTWVRFTASQALRALRGLERLDAVPEAN